MMEVAFTIMEFIGNIKLENIMISETMHDYLGNLEILKATNLVLHS